MRLSSLYSLEMFCAGLTIAWARRHSTYRHHLGQGFEQRAGPRNPSSRRTRHRWLVAVQPSIRVDAMAGRRGYKVGQEATVEAPTSTFLYSSHVNNAHFVQATTGELDHGILTCGNVFAPR